MAYNMYTYTYIWIYTCIQMYITIYTYTYIYTYIYACKHRSCEQIKTRSRKRSKILFLNAHHVWLSHVRDSFICVRRARHFYFFVINEDAHWKRHRGMTHSSVCHGSLRHVTWLMHVMCVTVTWIMNHECCFIIQSLPWFRVCSWR